MKLASAIAPILCEAPGRPVVSFLGSPRGERSAEKRRSLRGSLSGWRSRSTRFSRRALPACDRGEPPLGAPHAAFSLRRRAALCPRTAKQGGPPSASSWQGPIVVPGGAPAPPECGLRTRPRAPHRPLNAFAPEGPNARLAHLRQNRRPPLRLRHVSGRRPSESGTFWAYHPIGRTSRYFFRRAAA